MLLIHNRGSLICFVFSHDIMLFNYSYARGYNVHFIYNKVATMYLSVNHMPLRCLYYRRLWSTRCYHSHIGFTTGCYLHFEQHFSTFLSLDHCNPSKNLNLDFHLWFTCWSKLKQLPVELKILRHILLKTRRGKTY